MSAGTTPALSPEAAPQRRVPRYKLTVPLDLTVLRSGIPDRIPGRTLEIGEGGLGVVVASRLLPGESVRVEFLLPHTTTPVRATAVVRYENRRGFGLQFLRLPVEQQSIIRYWTRSEGEILLNAPRPLQAAPPDITWQAPQVEPALFSSFVGEGGAGPSFSSEAGADRSFNVRRLAAFVVPILLLAAVLGWWHWEQGWSALEGPVLASEPPKPQLQVPVEAMQQRIRHKTMPEYPEAARQAGIQGTVVLDAVVNPEGAVAQLKVLSGPEALSRAATDAVRWWRYEPYLINGQPATVETNVVVNFRLGN